MTKRFLLQKIKRSIPISNDVIHPNFNKYYLNRYKNQPIIPITQQYSYAYQRKRKPPIFRNFETRFAEDQIGSIDHESARARTCTPVLIPLPPVFVSISALVREIRASINENYCSPATHNRFAKRVVVTRFRFVESPRFEIFHDRDPLPSPSPSPS